MARHDHYLPHLRTDETGWRLVPLGEGVALGWIDHAAREAHVPPPDSAARRAHRFHLSFQIREGAPVRANDFTPSLEALRIDGLAYRGGLDIRLRLDDMDFSLRREPESIREVAQGWLEVVACACGRGSIARGQPVPRPDAAASVLGFFHLCESRLTPLQREQLAFLARALFASPTAATRALAEQRADEWFPPELEQQEQEQEQNAPDPPAQSQPNQQQTPPPPPDPVPPRDALGQADPRGVWNDPRAAIVRAFNEAADAGLTVAMPDEIAELLMGGFPGRGRARGGEEGTSSRMEIHRHEAGRRAAPGRGRRWRPARKGEELRFPSEEDGRGPFGRRTAGGTLLLDCSTSMYWDWSALEAAMADFPSLTVAAYRATDMGNGRLCILAHDGRWSPFDPSEFPGRHNGVDLEALQWLARQRGPRAWLSDGAIHGGRYAALGKEGPGTVRDICTRAAIVRVDSVDTATTYLRTGNRRLPGVTEPRNAAFLPHERDLGL